MIGKYNMVPVPFGFLLQEVITGTDASLTRAGMCRSKARPGLILVNTVITDRFEGGWSRSGLSEQPCLSGCRDEWHAGLYGR